MENLELDTIICGDNCEVMRKMPSESIDLVVTSPPYLSGRVCPRPVVDGGSAYSKFIALANLSMQFFSPVNQFRWLRVLPIRFCVGKDAHEFDRKPISPARNCDKRSSAEGLRNGFGTGVAEHRRDFFGVDKFFLLPVREILTEPKRVLLVLGCFRFAKFKHQLTLTFLNANKWEKRFSNRRCDFVCGSVVKKWLSVFPRRLAFVDSASKRILQQFRNNWNDLAKPTRFAERGVLGVTSNTHAIGASLDGEIPVRIHAPCKIR